MAYTLTGVRGNDDEDRQFLGTPRVPVLPALNESTLHKVNFERFIHEFQTRKCDLPPPGILHSEFDLRSINSNNAKGISLEQVKRLC